MGKTRVLLSSDFLLLRTGVRTLLSGYSTFEVVGESGSGPETVARLRELRPDILVLDVPACDREPLAAIADLVQQAPATRLIVLSETEDSALVLPLLRSGVHGYLSRREAPAELVRAVETVARGGVFLCPTASEALVNGYRKQARSHKRNQSPSNLPLADDGQNIGKGVPW